MLSFRQTLKMKTKFLVTLALISIFSNTYAQKKADSTQFIHRPADIGLIYPISTNGRQAALYSNAVSIQLLTGVSGEVSACAFAGIGNIIKGNSTGGDFAGIFNIAGKDIKGAQFAGITNIVNGKVHGAQFAGIYNQSHIIKGIQLSGIGSISDSGDHAVQISGLYNRSKTVQSQMAGLINIAHKVNGVQLSGLLNIADSSDYPIGFINLVKNGEKSIGFSFDENLNSMLSFYSGSKFLYGMLGIGYNFRNDDQFYALQAGIGAHFFNKGKNFRLNTEAVQLVQTDFKNGHCFTYSLKALPEITIGKKLRVFAGPSVNLQLDYSDGKIAGATSHHFWTTTGHNSHFIGGYIGMTGGMKFIL